MPVLGAQIYIPRIPGIPNTFPYLPDKFGLDFEVRAPCLGCAAVCFYQLVLLQLPRLLELSVQSWPACAQAPIKCCPAALGLSPARQALLAANICPAHGRCAGHLVPSQQAPASMAKQRPSKQGDAAAKQSAHNALHGRPAWGCTLRVALS